MVTVGFKLAPDALLVLRRQLEAKLIPIVSQIAERTYNYILHEEFPYYSGSYISSWNISIDSPDTSYAPPVWKRGVYLAPRESNGLTISSPYQPIYISNYAPHAYQVENVGTPKHSGGWHIAINARNAVVMGHRFF